jgi:hypothetical protein
MSQVREKAARWYAEVGRKRQYLLDAKGYADLFRKQNGLCAICGRPERFVLKDGGLRALSVDHNHETGQIRGLLCHACNVALGLLQDDPEVLSRAVTYLLIN